MVKIIEHNNYNEPVNHETVEYIRVPNPGGNPNDVVKAFNI